MGYFPFFIDIGGKSCIVVGGGRVALRKLEKLLPFEPDITVVAPEICDEIYRLYNIKILKKKYEDTDIHSAFMVISATDNAELNRHIFELCTQNGILVNTVDDKRYCTFVFPAMVKKNNFTVAVSTEGKAPLAARYMRSRIEEEFDESFDNALEALAGCRELVKAQIKTESGRKKALERIFSLCLEGRAAENEIYRIIEEINTDEN